MALKPGRPVFTSLEKDSGEGDRIAKEKLSSAEEFFELFPEAKRYSLMVPKGPRRRPKDAEKQGKHYSGKKKRYTMKNIVVNDSERSILLVSETQEGKIHDCRKFKESAMPQGIPDSMVCCFYNGFQGLTTDFPDLMVRILKRKRTTQI